jgi:hypothetical protein
MSYGKDADTDVVAASPTNVPTPVELLPHASIDAKIRTTFVDASPTPASCSEQASDSVHAVAPTSGPETWKIPTRKLGLLSCAKHSWKPALASPVVAVPRSNSRYSLPDATTENEAPTYPIGTRDAVAQVSPLATTFTLFEFENPVPVS